MGVNSWLDFAPAPRFPETPERKERRQIVVVIGRISSRGYLTHIKMYPNGVEDEVTQRCKTIVEVIRGIVFCLLAYKGDKRMLDPLDLSQWEFYVVKTSEIDRIFGERSSISINRVKELSQAYSVDALMDAVEAAYSADPHTLKVPRPRCLPDGV